MLQINGIGLAIDLLLEVYLDILGVELDSDFISGFKGKAKFSVVVGFIIAGVGETVG